MNTAIALDFAHSDVFDYLLALDDDGMDAVDFGIIGIDRAGVVCQYNSYESRLAGLAKERVLGHALFTVVAPCMNNFMVAQRFEDAAASGVELDTIVDYVLTLRMRPVKVRLRLLARPAAAVRYVLVERKA